MISRNDLETSRSLLEAAEIVNDFIYDRETYPDKEFHLRKGSCQEIGKIILEEYAPLVQLAQKLDKEYGPVQAVHLFVAGNEGPDGRIIFEERINPLTVQVTRSLDCKEGHQEAQMREKFSRKEIVVDHLKPVAARLKERIDRIIDAIGRKEKKYHKGTDVLLVVDATANFKYLYGLHDKVQETIRKNQLVSQYDQIYVTYGSELIKRLN